MNLPMFGKLKPTLYAFFGTLCLAASSSSLTNELDGKTGLEDRVQSLYEPDRQRKRVIQGVAVTGHNDVLGEPFFDWGPPFGAFGFVTLGIYNEYGSVPLPLSTSSDDSAIVATTLDPRILAPNGITDEDVNPQWLNIPLRQVPTTINFYEKKALPGIFDAEPSEKAQAGPVEPITLGQWMSASGTAKILCFDDGHSTIRLRMKNLIANRLYGVWSTLGPSKRGDPEIFPSLPIGGVPNLFVSDGEGDALYERSLQFCPLTPEATDRPMLVINVQLHSNHQNYGAINGPPLAQVPNGYWIGTVIHNHLQFPVNVKPLP